MHKYVVAALTRYRLQLANPRSLSLWSECNSDGRVYGLCMDAIDKANGGVIVLDEFGIDKTLKYLELLQVNGVALT